MLNPELINDIQKYINQKLRDFYDAITGPRIMAYVPMRRCNIYEIEECDELDSMLDIFDYDESFSEYLIRMIDSKGLTDAECYHKAQINKSHFNKIKNNKDYKPKKNTVIAFAMALELNKDETIALLESAGFALAHNNQFDIIIEYCIEHKIYDLIEVNQILFYFDCELLGAGIRE